jgi:hypothetical protein
LGIYKICYNLPKIGSKSKTNKTYFYFLEKGNENPRAAHNPQARPNAGSARVHTRPTDAAHTTQAGPRLGKKARPRCGIATKPSHATRIA